VISSGEPGHQRLQGVTDTGDVKRIQVTVVTDKVLHAFEDTRPRPPLVTAPHSHHLRGAPLVRVGAVKRCLGRGGKTRVPCEDARGVGEGDEAQVAVKFGHNELGEVCAFAVDDAAPDATEAGLAFFDVGDDAAGLRPAHHGDAHHLLEDFQHLVAVMCVHIC